jgi:sugar lactone lactonase YvrE
MNNMKLHTNKFYTLIAIVIGITVGSCKKSSSAAPPAGGGASTVSTLSGTGSAGSVNATLNAASFNFPSAVAVTSTGSSILYVGDFGNSLVRTIDLSAKQVSTFAGTGVAGFLNGPALAAKFNGTANIVFDVSGNLFVADEGNNIIREISSSGNVTTIAGTGVAGYQDGAGNSAMFDHPEGMVIDASGNLFVADGHNNVIRKIKLSTGAVSTFAGVFGNPGFVNGPANAATFNDPYGLTLDASGNIYVADIKNNCIRKITLSTNLVSVFAGSGTKGFANGPAATAMFNYPLASAFDSKGNLYVSDTYNNVIRKVATDGTVSTVAGTGVQGLLNGKATDATFNFPIGIIVIGNTIYVADVHNHVIRQIVMTP